MTGTANKGGGQVQLADETVDALQRALAAEQAAVWVYGFVTAFLPAPYAHALDRDTTAHRALRDNTARLLRDAGATPHVAAPSYRPPDPVTDERSAASLVASAESDAANAWHAVLVHTDPDGSGKLRRGAVDALSGAAVRGTAWRDAAGQTPVAVALPGMPKR